MLKHSPTSLHQDPQATPLHAGQESGLFVEEEMAEVISHSQPKALTSRLC